jgi:signal transduction histidine kinase
MLFRGLLAGPRLVRVLYFSLALAALPLVIWNGFIQQVNAEWNDLTLRLLPSTPSEAVRQVVLVAVDDRTAARHGAIPLDRRILASGLRSLAQARPRVLAVDLLLSEPGDPGADAELARSLALFPHRILGAALGANDSPSPVWIWPLPELEASSTVAHVHAAPDPDGDVRSVLLAKVGESRRLWALGLESARLFLRADRPVETEDSILLGSLRIPATASSSRTLWINYSGPEGTFQRVSFADLIERPADAAIFRDKLVILGVTAQGAGDRVFTPVSVGIGMSGIEIHANVFRTIVDQAFVEPLGPTGEVVLGVLLIATTCFAVFRLQGTRLFVTFVALAGLLFSAGFASVPVGYSLPIGSLLMILAIAATIAGVAEYAILGRSLATEVSRRKEYASRVQAIAHEIKTPLTAILGSSEMISEGLVPEQQRVEMAGIIHKESKRLTGLVETFLNVERVASGAVQLEKRPVALRQLCQEVVERGQLYAARKKSRVELEAPDLQVRADPELLSFAIYNLITNGVKYSPKSSTIQVRVEDLTSEVHINVTDNGQGIAPGEKEKIFERFYRSQPAENRGEEGTGIGLSLVKEIVQQHGGTIAVESAPGAGSRFTIAVPKE